MVMKVRIRMLEFCSRLSRLCSTLVMEEICKESVKWLNGGSFGVTWDLHHLEAA